MTTGDNWGYGRPPAYGSYPPPPAAPYPEPPRPAATVNVAGLVLSVVAAVLGVLAFTVLDWFDGQPTARFAKVHDVLAIVHSAHSDNPVSYLYFNWLAWALLGVAVLTAVAANVPSPATTAFRVLGCLTGLAGIALTFLAIRLVSGGPLAGTATPNGYGEYLKHARAAFYVAVAAFVLTTVASLIGSRPPRPR